MRKKVRAVPKRVPPAGSVEIFTPYIRLKDGRIIRPTSSKVFHFFVRV